MKDQKCLVRTMFQWRVKEGSVFWVNNFVAPYSPYESSFQCTDAEETGKLLHVVFLRV